MFKPCAALLGSVALIVATAAPRAQGLSPDDVRPADAKRHDVVDGGRRADLACFSDSDCVPGTACHKGSCLTWPLVAGFTFVDADRNVPVPWRTSITDGTRVHLDLLPALALRADTEPAVVGSVRLRLFRNGALVHEALESIPPYALFGGEGSDYLPWPDGGPEAGSYTLEAVAFSEAAGGGLASPRRMVSFEFAGMACAQDGECDDGVWCNGGESCVVGRCVSGLPPCGAEPCTEELQSCGPPPCQLDDQCDDGLFCNGKESCVVGRCVGGLPPCKDEESCSEAKGTCGTAGWSPPLGIPRPDFGIAEAAPPYDAGDPAHFFVDNSHPQATNEDNPNGSPQRPRTTIPLDLPAGAVVEVHGGPYNYVNLAAKMFVTGDGTPQRPIFVRGRPGQAPPVFTKSVFVRGGYLIFENLRFEDDGFELRPLEGDIHHVAIRRCEFAGSGSQTGGGTIKVVGNPTIIRDVVIYDNHIHHNGDDDPDAPELGRHGILVSYNTRRVWILDNLIHDNGEDAVQVNFHGDVPDKEPARHVYIGRNDMYGDRENALDLKICEDVVVSENRMSGYVETHTSSGEAVVVHQDQPTDDYPHPRRVWVLNNEIFDSRLGVVITGGEDVYVVGNLLRDIRHEAGESYDPASIYSGGVAVHARNSGPVVVASNTIVRCDSGVTASADLTLSGNLIAALAEPQSFHLNVNAGSDHPVSADHDLYYQPGGSARVLWGGTAYEVDELRAAVKQELHGLEADPLLADMAAGDFHLTAASPAVDAGDLHAAYSDFLDLYGLNIAVDLDGGPRPYNRLLDIGADEWRE